jgi:hypothetical protein
MFPQRPWMKQNEPFRWIILVAFLAALAFAIYAIVLR